MAIYYKDTLVAGSGGSDGLPTTGGTMSGDINMDSNKITNLPEPTQDGDAANKGYVDGAVDGFLPVSGGTMTGPLSMGGNPLTVPTTPTSNFDAVSKRYVDLKIATDALPIEGGVMTGNIGMNGNKITDLGTPSSPNDAATVSYVDQQFNSSHFLSVSGGTMYGNINMDEQKITNVGTPTADTDVATKGYVDLNSTGMFITFYVASGQLQTITFQAGTPKFVVVFEDGAIMTPDFSRAPFAMATQDYSFGNIRLNDSSLLISKDTAGVNTVGRKYAVIAFI